jgi:hypothetical protein
VHPDHSPAFHALADSYPKHHDAGLFLAGYGLGLHTGEESGPPHQPDDPMAEPVLAETKEEPVATAGPMIPALRPEQGRFWS